MRLIDADELLSKKKVMSFDGYDNIFYVDVMDVIHAPTVKIKNNRYGEWINDSGYDDYYCSECGFEINYDGEYPSEYSDFRYCGCCGANMDKIQLWYTDKKIKNKKIHRCKNEYKQ